MPDYTLPVAKSEIFKPDTFISPYLYKCFLMSYCVDTRDDSVTLETKQVTPLCISHGESTTITANLRTYICVYACMYVNACV